MVITTKDFKNSCKLILSALDGSELSAITETLELKALGKTLTLCVTNKEYFCTVKFLMDHEEDFHATVNASLFLKLISQITTDQVEMNIKDTYIEVKANGVYKIPLIFENDKLLELPVININNKTVEMDIDSNILQSIQDYNSKELLKGTIAKPVQRMFYVDQEGCITFTSGACVNSFTLAKPVKLLLNSRLVKLFKLFKEGQVKFTLGYDALSESIMQTKVRFENDVVELTAVLVSDDALMNSVPVSAIRNRANASYQHSVVINRELLMEAINRLLLFSSGYGTKQTLKPYSLFEFKNDSVTVYDSNKENSERLIYNNSALTEDYSMILDLTDFKTILENCTDQYITLSFGNHQAAVLIRNNIRNVIPEVREK